MGSNFRSIKKAVAPGDTYAGVPRLTRLLRLVGDLPANAISPVDPPVYSGALVDAVKNFQRRHGRDPNGRLDAQTLADLNVPLSRRVWQMKLTLERWRWMPDSYQRSPIVVNIPEFRLRAYDKDFNIGVTMNVVVGKAYGGHDTPVFTDTMKYVVFRPYWEVPPSITHGEMIPHIMRDPEYLASKGFEVVDSQQNGCFGGNGHARGCSPNFEWANSSYGKSRVQRTRSDWRNLFFLTATTCTCTTHRRLNSSRGQGGISATVAFGWKNLEIWRRGFCVTIRDGPPTESAQR